jgi:cellulose synthase/poly-beta-1,6-N-acetylglucosamine synthase-like glycosyltransferase/transposase-like protein
MAYRLSAQDKLTLIKRASAGESISQICESVGVSRTIFYKWLKLYKSSSEDDISFSFLPKYKRGTEHWNKISVSLEKKIIRLALRNPTWSPVQLSKHLPCSASLIWTVLKRKGFNTIALRQQHSLIYGDRLIGQLSPNDKLNLMRRYQTGESVTSLAREYRISRTSFYKWLKTYQNSSETAKLSLFKPKRPNGDAHWRYIVGSKDLVLEIVIEHPDFSAHRIKEEIVRRFGKQILSSYTVHLILKSLGLNTFESRLAFVASKSSLSNQFPEVLDWELPAIPRYSFISSLSPPFIEEIIEYVKEYGPLASISSLVSFVGLSLLHEIHWLTSHYNLFGLFFSCISLLFGMFFFFYSLKYYLTIAMVLSFSRRGKDKIEGFSGWLARVFSMPHTQTKHEVTQPIEIPAYSNGDGLRGDVSDVLIERQPFISIQVSTYNEKRVIDRLLTALTSMDYENYEIIVADDSNDETITLLEQWGRNPRVKISHRTTRDGYKGQALAGALQIMDPRTEFVLVFDADFIPYPDTITQFLKYFKLAVGSLEVDQIRKTSIASVQGYQWHVLNKSENWITRGVRSEYSGSYVIERSGTELYGGLKQISGSVYMIRADVLKQVGWGRSITEDFELTLRLYQAGYKVIYTPYVQAPAEAVSTIRRLIRQRMRWAEGHSYNIKKMFGLLLYGKRETQIADGKQKKVFVPSPLGLAEKFELFYLAPYYLQAAFFLLGTAAWFLAEVVFRTRLPFWTEVWGWSLVFTNLFALPLMNLVGLFMEESEEKDYLGLFSFVALSYIVAPFQAYAAVKGFLEKEEGPWFRTPKTGRITDTFMPGRLARFVKGVFAPITVHADQVKLGTNPYVALATAHNRFDSFKIQSKKSRYIGNYVVLLGILLTCILFYKSEQIQEGTLADLPVATHVESLSHPSLSYRFGSLLTPEHVDAANLFHEISLQGVGSTVSNHTVLLYSLFLLLIGLSTLVYLFRKHKKVFLSLMRGFFVFLLLLSTFVYNWLPLVSNNLSLFGPHKAAADAQEIKSVQTGSKSFATNVSSTTVTISSVTTSQAFLIFSQSDSDTAPQCSQIAGELTNSTTITFSRNSSSCGSTITIQWYVAEFNNPSSSNGVSVQRGNVDMTNAGAGVDLNVTITSVNTAHSFVILTKKTNGTTYDGNDFVRAKLTSSTNLVLHEQNTGNTGADIAYWQVIEYANSNVQSGEVSFGNTDASKTATISPVDVAKTWLLFSYDYDINGNLNPNQYIIRGRITSPTQLTFDRQGSIAANDTSTLDYFVVSFTDATTVQSGNAALSSGTSTLNVTLNTVDTGKTIAYGGGWFGRGGSTDYSSTDDPSGATVTYTFTTSTNLQLVRGSTNGNINVGWFAITFNASTQDESAYRWFNNANSTDVGSALAGTNTVPSSISTGSQYRLRILVKMASADMNQWGQFYKLQVASKGSNCSSSTYSDVATSSGSIRFYDNASPSDGAGLTTNANDPTNSTTVNGQNYLESNSYSYNSRSAITSGQSGEIDFALNIPATTSNGNYCMRLVRLEDGTTLDTYTVYPEINVVPENPILLFGMLPFILYMVYRRKKKRAC